MRIRQTAAEPRFAQPLRLPAACRKVPIAPDRDARRKANHERAPTKLVLARDWAAAGDGSPIGLSARSGDCDWLDPERSLRNDRSNHSGAQPVARRPAKLGIFSEASIQKTAATGTFLAVAHPENRYQSGFTLFFPQDASIDAVHAQARPREPCHALRSHLSARPTETAAGSEAWGATAAWWSFSTVS